MARVLALVALLLPSFAFAQTASAGQVVAVESSDRPNESISLAECQGTAASSFAFNWQLPSTAGTPSQTVFYVSNQANCPEPSTTVRRATLDTQVTTSLTGRFPQGSGTIAVIDLLSRLALVDAATCQSNSTLYFCAVGSVASGSAIATGTVQIDVVKPAAPSITGVFPGDEALTVHWGSAAGGDTYVITATAAEAGAAPTRTLGPLDALEVRIDDLVNDVTYNVTVRSISEGGNESDESIPAQGTPRLVNDFWRMYQNAGGQEQGGCSTTGRGPLALLAVVALALRRRRAARALLVVGLVAAADPAVAEESPRRGSFEFRVLPYRPDIDAEFEGSSAVPPYEQAFGNDRRWMTRIDVSKALWIGTYGALELGAGVGYFQAKGAGRLAVDGSESGDSTALRIIPTALHLTYRFDMLAERYKVPLAPYARLALERYNWWITNGSNDTAESNGLKGRGATNGWSATAGIAFLLDIIDPGLARDMDNSTGVNSTYAYFEASRARIDDFGSSSSLDLSPESGWLLAGGLLFIF